MNKMSVAALALVVACGTAMAAESTPSTTSSSSTATTTTHKHPTFESLDKNKDGKLTKEEYSKWQ